LAVANILINKDANRYFAALLAPISPFNLMNGRSYLLLPSCFHKHKFVNTKGSSDQEGMK